MSTIYSVRSSAVRAAKKACGPEQEWTIQQAGEGFTFSILDINEKQPAPTTTAAKVEAGVIKVNIAKERKAAQVLAETGATEAEHVAHRAEPVKSTAIKPFQLAKQIVSNCVSQGITSRKEIIQACVSQGVKLNTADGAHYELCVRKS